MEHVILLSIDGCDPEERIKSYIKNLIIKVLDVSLEYLSAPSIVSISDVMITLMEQEIDHLNEVTFDEMEYINHNGEPKKRTGVYFNRADLESSLAEWAKVKKELSNGDISLAEYDEWKTNWPATLEVYNSNSPKQWKKDK